MRDLLAAVSIAGLLIPEAVAYSGLAGLPPQAGLIALLIGLVVYGLTGSSRYAIVSSTSSSAAVLAATVQNMGGDPGTQLAVAAMLVAVTGVLFMLASAARLGGMSDFISRPVLRGFTFGLALTIVIKQLPTILVVPVRHSDTPRIALDLLAGLPHANLVSLAVGGVALAVLFTSGHGSRLPASLLVIVMGIVAGYIVDWHQYGVAVVGAIDLQNIGLHMPRLDRNAWLQAVELGMALVLILYAESYGSIRSFALKHGDTVSANRDLFALGCANLLSGLLRGMPVGAGYSATSANEAAGARSRRAGLFAALIIALAVWLLLPQLARTPEAVLAAIVIFAVSHSLHPAVFRPYWIWQRDRLVTVAAILAVLVLGVLHGLLAGIGLSLIMTLRKLSEPKLSTLGRLGSSHDFVDLAQHAEAKAVPGVLIVRPEAQMFFANADRLFNGVLQLIKARPELRAVMLSLEESPDLDGTSLESLQVFTAACRSRNLLLILARLKPAVLQVLERVSSEQGGGVVLSELSVDESLQMLAPASAPAEEKPKSR
ncbi:MAG TPA: SulP family inorganic anion transporter [Bordetella sp.]|uniref:SulP family inorganic anion transporter n=1 Tax=Bordetella sp. TaxID=28081 RepID=UPI002ED5D544